MPRFQSMRRAAVLAMVFCASAALAIAQDKLAVPDRAAQKTAGDRIRTVFADEYKSTDRATKAKLAKQLLELATGEKDDAAKFTLYREAVRLGSEAGDVATALSAVDQMSAAFNITPSAVRLYAISNLTKLALPAREAGMVADECLALATALSAEDDFKGAERAVDLGFAAIRRARDNQRMAKLRDMKDYIEGIADEFKTVAAHAAKLKEDPTDPQANLEMGKFHCFVKGNWQTGLRHLANGGDEALEVLAADTLAEPGDAPSQFKIANGWWKQADKLEGVERDRVLAYAGTYYERAIPGLTGLSKATAVKRLSEVPDVAGGAVVQRQKDVNLLALIDPDKDFKPKDKWAVANGVLQCTRGSFVPKVVFPYQPPQEYDISFTYSQPSLRNGVGVILPNPNPNVKASFAFIVGESSGRSIMLSNDQGKYRQTFPKAVIQENTKYTVVVKVRKTGVAATINGTPVANLQTDFSDLKVNSWRKIDEWQNAAIFCDDPTAFYQVQIKEVTGEGPVTRFPTE